MFSDVPRGGMAAYPHPKYATVHRIPRWEGRVCGYRNKVSLFVPISDLATPNGYPARGCLHRKTKMSAEIWSSVSTLSVPINSRQNKNDT